MGVFVCRWWFEIVWATGIKYSDGFTRLWPSVGTVAAMSVSMVCLALAARAIPIGTAYAIWTRYWRRGCGYCRHCSV